MPNAAYAEPAVIESWLANRGVGIGSSDAAAVVGLSPYKSALDVWVEKVYPTERTGELPESPAMRAGLILEPAIARWYEIETGTPTTEPKAAIHPVHPFMGATADRIAETQDGPFLIEIKTANERLAPLWGEVGTDEIPQHYLIQVQHQLAVYGLSRCDVAVLIGGSDFRIYTVQRSDAAIESLIDAESDFWRMVVDQTPPEPDWSHASTPELISRLYRPREGKEIDLPAELAASIETRRAALDDIKRLERIADEHKARLIHAMGDAATAHVAGYKLARKTIERKAYSVEAKTYVDFRITQPKGMK